MKKQLTLTHDGFETVWQSGDKGMIDVDVFAPGNKEPILQWSFPKLAGNSIAGNAAIFLEQAIMYAVR